MALIKITVRSHRCELVEADPLATGSAGVDALVLDGPDESWEGFSLSAAFSTEGGVYYSVVTDGSAPIPAAALAYKRFGIALYGTRGADGSEQRYTTNFVHVVIPEGAGSGGTTPPEPSESLYSQVVAIAEHAEDMAQSVVDRADAGEFTGPQGIQGPPGEVTEAELTEALAGKVSVVNGKGLSTNDYTDAEKLTVSLVSEDPHNSAMIIDLEGTEAGTVTGSFTTTASGYVSFEVIGLWGPQTWGKTGRFVNPSTEQGASDYRTFFNYLVVSVPDMFSHSVILHSSYECYAFEYDDRSANRDAVSWSEWNEDDEREYWTSGQHAETRHAPNSLSRIVPYMPEPTDWEPYAEGGAEYKRTSAEGIILHPIVIWRGSATQTALTEGALPTEQGELALKDGYFYVTADTAADYALQFFKIDRTKKAFQNTTAARYLQAGVHEVTGSFPAVFGADAKLRIRVRQLLSDIRQDIVELQSRVAALEAAQNE